MCRVNEIVLAILHSVLKILHHHLKVKYRDLLIDVWASLNRTHKSSCAEGFSWKCQQSNWNSILTENNETSSDDERAQDSWSRKLRLEFILDQFVGHSKTPFKFPHCGHCALTFETFWDMLLLIPQKQVILECLKVYIN